MAARTRSSAPWGPSSISATSSATGGTRSTARRPPASTSSTKTSTSDAKQALLGFVKTRVVLIIRNATSFSIYGQYRQHLHKSPSQYLRRQDTLTRFRAFKWTEHFKSYCDASGQS